MPEVKFTEEQMVALARNALLVAGYEMGETGDHWPVINSTIYSLMKDWENLKVGRNVHEELRIQLYAHFGRMEEALKTCSDDIKADAAPKLEKLRELYDAYFTPVDENQLRLSEEDTPAYVKRAQAIIKTLEDEDA
jgi:hypothetical protein